MLLLIYEPYIRTKPHFLEIITIFGKTPFVLTLDLGVPSFEDKNRILPSALPATMRPKQASTSIHDIFDENVGISLMNSLLWYNAIDESGYPITRIGWLAAIVQSGASSDGIKWLDPFNSKASPLSRDIFNLPLWSTPTMCVP